MKKTTIIIISLLISQFSFSASKEFSTKEQSIINTESLKILKSYSKLINTIGASSTKNVEEAKSKAESLIELFINRKVQIYNDLDPFHKLSEFYEVETYASNLILWYPDGINVILDFDNAKVSNIMQHDENVFSLDVLVTKKIDGNYLNKSMNNNTEELAFRIAFAIEKKSIKDFRIAGVRNVKSATVIDDAKALKEVGKEELSETELNKVYEGLKGTLKDYNNYLSLIGDPQELEEDKEFYKTSFFNLFKNEEVKIYNDIEPNPKNVSFNLKEYLTSYEKFYPEGIKNIALNIDSAEFGTVSKNDKGEYYTYAYVDKFFSGSFQGKEMYRKMYNLMYKINFQKSGNTYTNFTFENIDVATIEFYNQNNDSLEQLPNIPISPVSRKGLSVLTMLSYGLSSIGNMNINALTMDENFHSWNVSNENGYKFGVMASYFISDNIGFSAGISYNTIGTKYNLQGTFQDDELSYDIDGDHFYKNIEAEYDSVVNLNYLNIPILIDYISSSPTKIGFYAKGGVYISYNVSGNYELRGNYKYSGYYPDANIQLQHLTTPELGFFNRENLDVNNSLTVKKINLSLYGGFGINIPISYYTSLQFGPEIIMGFSDISDNKKEFVDIFGKLKPHEPIKIKKYGLKFAVVYKL
ncbi:MAG: PorT family protein [Bacteroidetes bacterium]|nr:PorT family protein [Bacteroidota bacterium]